jgi:hypothetical protein
MTFDPRLHHIVAAQPYPLLFATISRRRSEAMAGLVGAHLYGFPSSDSVGLHERLASERAWK